MAIATRNSQLATKVGFTLVELSIVLVIIGLLIGGILVAQSLIESAELKNFVRTVQKFDIAVSNFKNKYRTLPGDSPAFGCTNSTNTCGDRQITSSNGNIDTWDGEVANFWPQLYKAGMMGGGKIYTASVGTGTFVFCGSNSVNGPISPYKFTSKATHPGVGDGNCVGFVAYSAGGKAYYQTLGNKAQTSYAGKIRPDGSAVCYDGQIIDSKMDDGQRSTGNIIALNSQVLSLNTNPVNTCNDHGNGWTPDNGDYNCAMWAARGIDCKQAYGGSLLNLRFEMLSQAGGQ